MSDTPRTDAKFDDYVKLLHEAEVYASQQYSFNKFADGSPLKNDVPVWLVEFAQDKSSLAKKLERENQQLRVELETAKADRNKSGVIERQKYLPILANHTEALKQCAEALNQNFQGLSLHEYLFTQYPATQGNILLRDFCTKQDNAHSAVQAALKEKA